MPSFYGTSSNDAQIGAYLNMYGYGGDDDLTTDIADSLIDGGSGNDLLTFARSGWGTIYGGNGVDALIGGVYGNNSLYGGIGSDFIRGGGGSEPYPTIVDYIYGGSEADALYGNNGDDFLYGGADNDKGGIFTVLMDLHGIRAEFGLYGGRGNDYLDGGTGSDFLDGGYSEDTIYGGDGAYDDTIVGNYGSDDLYGGDGNDVLYGDHTVETGAGADLLDGGFGNDTYYVDIHDTIIEYLNRGMADKAFVRAGDFSLAEQAQVEYLEFEDQSGTGNWSLTGSWTKNDIVGNMGENTLTGLLGNDTLTGLGGDDTLSGDEGLDVLTGGDGDDYFVFDTTPQVGNEDIITDFDFLEDTIVIVMSAFPAIDPDLIAYQMDDYHHEFPPRPVWSSGDAIFYDPQDGSSPVKIVTLAGDPILLTSNIVFV
jgi:Ca2+-binding RTX toxin-like protein